MNAVVQKAVERQHPPSFRGAFVRIKYANQVREAPPVFVFFCNHPEGVKESYRRYLEETSKSSMTPEAMRRLADLQIEQAYGVIGSGVYLLPAAAAALLVGRLGANALLAPTLRG